MSLSPCVQLSSSGVRPIYLFWSLPRTIGHSSSWCSWEFCQSKCSTRSSVLRILSIETSTRTSVLPCPAPSNYFGGHSCSSLLRCCIDALYSFEDVQCISFLCASFVQAAASLQIAIWSLHLTCKNTYVQLPSWLLCVYLYLPLFLSTCYLLLYHMCSPIFFPTRN